MKQLKGSVVKVQNRYIKFRKNSVIYDKQNKLIQGELIQPTRLQTTSCHNLLFRGVVKFNSEQKVVKGFLSKPQKIEMKTKKITLKGFVQFAPEGALKKEPISTEKLENNFDQTLVSLIEEEINQAETMEYFTLANYKYIVRPKIRIGYSNFKKSNKKILSKY